MPAVEVLAYPALLGAIYGAFRVGRKRPISFDDRFEWLRACSLALLLGVLVVVQVRLVLAGRLTSTIGLAAGSLGIAAGVSLVGLTVFEMWQARAASRPEGETFS